MDAAQHAEAGASSSSSTLKLFNIPPADEEDKLEGVPLSFFTAVELEVLKRFVTNYASNKELTRDDGIALEYTFGPMFQQCLVMMEEEQIEIRQSPVTGRTLIQVFGTRETYWIPPGHSLCQCWAFVHGKKEYCKHVLAAHVFLAITAKKDYKPISDEELSKIFRDVL